MNITLKDANGSQIAFGSSISDEWDVQANQGAVDFEIQREVVVTGKFGGGPITAEVSGHVKAWTESNVFHVVDLKGGGLRFDGVDLGSVTRIVRAEPAWPVIVPKWGGTAGTGV